MSNSIAKIFGWVLLLAGVLIIIGTLYYSFNIFTGKSDVPEIFDIPETENIQQSADLKGKLPTSAEELQKGVENIVGEQLKNLLPTDTIPKLLNLSVWSLLAGLLIFGAGQIAGIGIKLLKG